MARLFAAMEVCSSAWTRMQCTRQLTAYGVTNLRINNYLAGRQDRIQHRLVWI